MYHRELHIYIIKRIMLRIHLTYEWQ